MSKLRQRLGTLEAVADTAWHLADQQTLNALATCETTLRRIVARTEASPGFERIEIKQRQGPTVEFSGRLLCEAEYVAHRTGLRMVLELYETQGGAMVAVSSSNLADESGDEDERCVVVPPIADVQAMQFAVMDAFGWRSEAKKMVRKKLGWDLRCEVA